MKYTPGPWRWEINKEAKRIQLTGGDMPFDITVMSFERWGMNSAQPTFLKVALPDHMLIEKAVSFSEIVPGRAHHSNWFQTINHPDANLIAAAPDLLEACEEAIKMYDAIESVGGWQHVHDSLKNAISKAKI
jgi:hypothetical protein